MPYKDKKPKNCSVCQTPILRSSNFCHKHKLFSDKHKKHISEATKGKPKLWAKGKKRPEHSKFLKKWWKEHPKEREKAKQRGKRYIKNPEWIKKVSSFGEKNPMWRGGITLSKYKDFYQTKKDIILKRDNFQCQLCGIQNGDCIKKIGHRLGTHHIDYNKINSKSKNLITLCNSCNSKINYDREKWTKYFQKKIASIYGKKKRKIITDVRIVG